MTEIRFLRADIATVSEGAPVRVYNTYTESYLPPRGLFFEVSDDRAYMITTGIYEERYTGMGTPKPIKVELLYTTENNRVALRETMKACYALTAMNWRNLFGSLRLPTPIHYAKLMARLLLISSEDDIADAFIYLRKKIKTEVETEWDLLKPVAFQDRPWFI
jgi:argonaute-like protein implicated in RNA metabolism and viral defense